MINENAYALGANRSAIRDLFEYGKMRAAIVGPENVLDFSLGNPSIPAPKAVNDTIAALLQDTDPLALHGYTSAVGDDATRQAIAEDLNARYPGANVDKNKLFLTCGAAPALTAVFRALAAPESEILAIAPFFPEYRPFAESAGLTFRVVPADIPDFQIDFAALEAMVNENTAAIILNSPNNPAGTVYTVKTLDKLAALLTEKAKSFGHPIYIVADEPYRELAYGVEVPFIPTIYKDTVVCYSYAKSLSLPGQRIGYVYVPEAATDSDALYAAVAGAARSMGHVCAPSLLQKVIARCAHLRPDLEAYNKNRTALYEGLVAAGYEVAKPDGAFYLFVKAPGLSGAEFSEKAKKKDLLVVPGDSFGCPDYFRLCYCVSYETITRSLPIFKSLL
ncbi:MAG: pyridoxal phosphate-dependent aminotransferase [Oscillospiraceae bacterium]|nr:pyridoxal phosphate-dependent aminotransferase [Oscillospiraceae bacterium]